MIEPNFLFTVKKVSNSNNDQLISTITIFSSVMRI